jgi:hypothetical protein
MRVKQGRTRALLTRRAAWMGFSVPPTVMRRAVALMEPHMQPRGLWATLRLAVAAARAAWICARAANTNNTFVAKEGGQ